MLPVVLAVAIVLKVVLAPAAHRQHRILLMVVVTFVVVILLVAVVTMGINPNFDNKEKENDEHFPSSISISSHISHHNSAAPPVVVVLSSIDVMRHDDT